MNSPFEKAFQLVLIQLGVQDHTISVLVEEIRQHYTEKHRHYHTLAHLDHLIDRLLPVKSEIEDWEVTVFAVAYHDIVYYPSKNDNEEQSATLATQRLAQLGVDEDRWQRCAQHILATKKHLVSEDADINYFTDADLCILGSAADRYKIYAAQVREEYKFYPGFIYHTGRRKVLAHFLQLPFIFKTLYFRDLFERPARENLSKELAQLR